METKLEHTDFSAYYSRYMKDKVLELYGEDIEVTGKSGKSNILTYRPKVSALLRRYYDQPKDVDVELQKIRLLEASATIIKSDTENRFHPGVRISRPPIAFCSNSLRYVPPTLQLLLSQLFSGNETDLKSAAIGQSIVQGQLWRLFNLDCPYCFISIIGPSI